MSSGEKQPPKEIKTLTISGTIYGEDGVGDYLRSQGYTERNWPNWAQRFLRRRKVEAGVRETATGTSLRLVSAELGEVDDRDKEK